jgi:hypothetical protein
MAIHHAILKAAAKLGVTLTETGNGTVCRAEHEGYYLEAATAKLALAEMKEAIENETLEELDAIEAEEEQDDEAESANVVPQKYKERYGSAQHCGDGIALALKDYLGEAKDKQERLLRFATANGLWDDKYDALNVGMQRMNIGNRLRAAIKRGDMSEKSVKWPK